MMVNSMGIRDLDENVSRLLPFGEPANLKTCTAQLSHGGLHGPLHLEQQQSNWEGS